MPRVSVIIPTYNRKDYVQEAIDSVLAQTYTDYEIIVVDDGSSDGTGQALQALYGDRIRYIWQENQGESMARNRGVELAQGEVIAFLDSDDLWMPEKLQQQVIYLETHSDADMVFSQAWLIDERGNRFGNEPLGIDIQMFTVLAADSLLFSNKVVGPSTVLLRHTAWQMTTGFDPLIKYGEDWDLWLQIARFKPIHIMNKPLALIRRHRGTQCYYPESSEKIAHVLRDHLRLLEKAAHSSADNHVYHQAIANQYLEAFVQECRVGTASRAHKYLITAHSYNYELLDDSKLLSQLILTQVAQIIEPESTNFTDAVEYVKTVLNHFQQIGIYNKGFDKKILAATYAVIGLWINQHWGPYKARCYLLNAIRQDVHWVKNTGLIITIVKSFVPR